MLSFLTLVGLVAGAGRLFLGLSAFAGTGFTMAAVVHVLHLKQYQPVLRPAILAGLTGYGAVLLLVLDLGRPDRFYNFIIFGNLHSPLFEISWCCVLLYTTVLVVETSPCLLRWLQRDWPLRLVYRLMTPVTIIGVTLSTLHQSTLGTLYLNMPHRLHLLWYTPMLPLLFFVSSIMAGLSLGMLIYKITSRVRGQAEQPGLVSGLGRGLVWVTLLYLLLKLGDMLLAGEAAALLVPGQISLVMGLELIAGALLPLALLLTPGLARATAGPVDRAAAGFVWGVDEPLQRHHVRPTAAVQHQLLAPHSGVAVNHRHSGRGGPALVSGHAVSADGRR